MHRFCQFWSRYGRPKKRGQTMAEYGLILALVAVVAIAAWTALGSDVSTLITSIATTL
jgi:Flp pilus assembly pilin Flp